MSTFQLSAILFGILALLVITSATLEYKKDKKMPRTSMVVVAFSSITLGMICLLMTYELFLQDKAELPIKHSVAFNKADHPIGFLFCTALNAGLGLIFLGLGAIVILRLFKNNQGRNN